MKAIMRCMAVALTLLTANLAFGQAAAPAGSTGVCKDGSFSTAASKSGACRGHKGVQTWYADAGAAKAAKPAAAAPAAKPAVTAKAPMTAPAAAPMAAKTAPASGATGVCKDGSYSMSASKSGACRGHQGVQTWYADAGGAKPAAATTPAAKAIAPAPAQAPAPVAARTPAPAPMSQAAAKSPAAAMPQAAGGGPGMVWVNTESKVYHCAGTKYYGKTKAGKYMSEADAKASGARADHGTACSK
jgi:hypothetical protein